MEVILDSSFIISAVKNGIDFLDSLENNGFNVKVPKEVLMELKDLRVKVPHDDRLAIDLAMNLLEEKKVKKIVLGKKKVDEGLIERGRIGSYIATLDSAIKRSVPNKVSISSSKKDILIERN